MNTLSRRDFLKIGASSALGLTLGKVIELDVLLPASSGIATRIRFSH